MNTTDLAARIKQAALDCDFGLCGIVKIDAMKGYATAIENRIARFPGSKPMYERLSAFADPREWFPGQNP